MERMMPLFAETTFLDWLMKMTEPGFIVAVGGLWTIIKTQKEMKTNLKINTDATTGIVPAVKDKLESATKEVHEAKEAGAAAIEAASQIVDNAATKAAVVVGAKLASTAKEIAVGVASTAVDTALATTDRLSESVDKLSRHINGHEETCLTGRLTKVETEVVQIKKTLAVVVDHTKQILELVTKPA